VFHVTHLHARIEHEVSPKVAKGNGLHDDVEPVSVGITSKYSNAVVVFYLAEYVDLIAKLLVVFLVAMGFHSLESHNSL